jgi:hypothetical protein
MKNKKPKKIEEELLKILKEELLLPPSKCSKPSMYFRLLRFIKTLLQEKEKEIDINYIYHCGYKQCLEDLTENYLPDKYYKYRKQLKKPKK